MVLANPNWFMKRRNGGWDLTEKFVKGILYILFVFGPIVLFHMLPFWSVGARVIVTCAWLAFIVIEIADVVRKLKKEQMGISREIISEKNALFGIISFLAGVILYQVYDSIMNQKVNVDWAIIAALFLAGMFKVITINKRERR